MQFGPFALLEAMQLISEEPVPAKMAAVPALSWARQDSRTAASPAKIP